MVEDFALFDFFGESELKRVSFSSIDINSVPIKEFFDVNRTGFVDANTKIASPTFSVDLVKKIYWQKGYEKTGNIKDYSTEDIVNDFFIHYLVFPDMPLEFNIKMSGARFLPVHGFIEDIKFSQNIGDPYYEMNIKVLAYNLKDGEVSWRRW